MTVMGLVLAAAAMGSFTATKHSSSLQGSQVFQHRFLGGVSPHTPVGLTAAIHPPSLLRHSVGRAAWDCTSLLAYAVTVIALYQLFIGAVMKQGMGRTPCCVQDPAMGLQWGDAREHFQNDP